MIILDITRYKCPCVTFRRFGYCGGELRCPRHKMGVESTLIDDLYLMSDIRILYRSSKTERGRFILGNHNIFY